MTTVKSAIRRLIGTYLPVRFKEKLAHASLVVLGEHRSDPLILHFQMASMEWSLRNLKALNFHPKNIVDVGAYEGEWTRMAKSIFRDSKVLMLEAQPKKEDLLKKVVQEYPDSVCYQINLLGAEQKDKVPFYELETGSSVLQEQSNIQRNVTYYAMETLDKVVRANLEGKVDLLKLDVQGYELEILRGGQAVLQDAEVVLMEVALLSINQGAPLLHEVVDFMKQHNFVAYDICSFVRRPLDKALWQTDFIFVKEGSALRSRQSYD